MSASRAPLAGPKNFPDQVQEAVILKEADLPESLNAYLPNPYLQKWLAALSFFPQLNWNLTIFSGNIIAKEYQLDDLLSFENLRKLTLLIRHEFR